MRGSVLTPRLFALRLVLALTCASGASQGFAAEALKERPVAVEAYPVARFSVFDGARRDFGKLTFLGGLELRSKDAEFGGLSSALIDADGKGFVALTDQAHWIMGRFTEQNNVLTGVEAIRIAPMIAPDGRAMRETRFYDSEGLARRGKSYFVSVERVHDILRFEAGPNGPSGRGTLLPVPEEMKRLGGNKGIEALGVMPHASASAGRLIALAERAPKDDSNKDMPGWLIGPKDSSRLSVKNRDSFDIADLAFLPGGDLLLLERRFTPFLGLAFRIRRVPLGSIKPGAVLDGDVLIEAGLTNTIDNMEALMVHKAQNGKIILTLMSDDNFSLLQRNLVLRFMMDE